MDDSIKADLKLLSDGLLGWAVLCLPESLDISQVSDAINKGEPHIFKGVIVNGRQTLDRIEQKLLVRGLSDAGRSLKARAEAFHTDLIAWREEAAGELDYNSVPDPFSTENRTIYELFGNELIERESELQSRAFGLAAFIKEIFDQCQPSPAPNAHQHAPDPEVKDDTKSDTAKKNQKTSRKRKMNAAAADCCRLFKKENGVFPMKTIVADYVAKHGGSIQSIMRVLNDNPEHWKDDQKTT